MLMLITNQTCTILSYEISYYAFEVYACISFFSTVNENKLWNVKKIFFYQYAAMAKPGDILAETWELPQN